MEAVLVYLGLGAVCFGLWIFACYRVKTDVANDYCRKVIDNEADCSCDVCGTIPPEFEYVKRKRTKDVSVSIDRPDKRDVR